MNDAWEESPSGLYLPAERPEVPTPPPPDVKFRLPRPGETLGFFGTNFRLFVEKMTGRPCPWCGEPVGRGDEHEAAASFACACGFRACVYSNGRMRVKDRESGVEATISIRERERP